MPNVQHDDSPPVSVPRLAEVKSLRVQHGLAGQVAITATVVYSHSECEERVTFVGTKYGEPGPVCMITHGGTQSFVYAPSRFGAEFNEAWVRAFFA